MEGRKRSLTDVLGARAREVEEGLSSWVGHAFVFSRCFLSSIN